MSDPKVDFQERFYVRLEDDKAGVFMLDFSQLDSAYLDEKPSLIDRIRRRNNRDLVNPDAR